MAARWALVVAWMCVVFIASSISDLGRAKRVPDWISHPIEYGAGAVLLCRALEGQRRRPVTHSILSTGSTRLTPSTLSTDSTLSTRSTPLSLSTALTATLLVTAYGVTDEYHQSFVPGRTADPADVVKDLAGAVVACALYRRWTSRDSEAPRRESGAPDPGPPAPAVSQESRAPRSREGSR